MFIEFMLARILEAIEKVGNVVGSNVGNRFANLTENQQTIISSMQSNPKVSAAMLAEIVGISKRKVEENVVKLKKMGLVERVGGTRVYWEALEWKLLVLNLRYTHYVIILYKIQRIDYDKKDDIGLFICS